MKNKQGIMAFLGAAVGAAAARPPQTSHPWPFASVCGNAGDYGGSMQGTNRRRTYIRNRNSRLRGLNGGKLPKKFEGAK